MRSSRALRIRFQGKLPIAMARIVLTSWGSYGDINPYVGLALALKARGHEPVLACPAYYQGLAASEGIAFHTVRPNIDPGNSEIVSRVMHPRRGPEVILRELMLPSVEDAYEDLSEAAVGADLLVQSALRLRCLPVPPAFHGFPVFWRLSRSSPNTIFQSCLLHRFSNALSTSDRGRGRY